MKKFLFSMHGVMNVRAAEKDAREIALVQARNKLEREKELLKEIEAEIVLAMRIEDKLDKITSRYLLLREKYLKKLKDQKKNQIEQVEQAKLEVAQALDLLKIAIIELKKMEKAKDREFEAWQLEYHREEQKIGDEIGTNLSNIRKASDRIQATRV